MAIRIKATTLDSKSYDLIPINNVGELQNYQTRLPKKPGPWLFRGVSRDYPLQTSLERALLQSDGTLENAQLRERQLLIEFKRRAHQYVQHLPVDGDLLEWMTLMQHYGAPTRLLDWTYSFHVAAYFALEKADSLKDPADPEPTRCVVWGLNRSSFTLKDQASTAEQAYWNAVKRSSPTYDFEQGARDKVQVGLNAVLLDFVEHPTACVWTINSFRLNDRLTVQQGVFLIPGDVSVSFEDNLRGGHPMPDTLVRFDISTETNVRSEMLKLLHTMNISHASLFPGLGGFAESLRLRLFTPEILRPEHPVHV